MQWPKAMRRFSLRGFTLMSAIFHGVEMKVNRSGFALARYETFQLCAAEIANTLGLKEIPRLILFFN